MGIIATLGVAFILGKDALIGFLSGEVPGGFLLLCLILFIVNL